MTTSISRTNVSPSIPERADTRSQANALLVAAGVIALAHLPQLILHAEQLWSKPHYQFFPLVLAGSLFLAWTRISGLGQLQPVRPIHCYPFVLLFFVLLAASVVINSPWLAAVVSLLTLMVAIVGIGGWPLAQRLLPAWILLWLAIPLPLRLDQIVINGLQAFTARWSSVVLDMLGVQHVLTGNVVEIAEKRLMVEEACSGIHSLFASLACTIFFVLWARRPIFRSILLVLSAIYWVVICNVGRVVTVTIVEVFTDFNLTEGTPHEILSLVIFACILGLVFSTDRLLLFLSPGFLFSQRRDEAIVADDIDPSKETKAPPVRETWVGSTPILVAYGVLAAVQLFTFWGNLGEDLNLAQLGIDTLPTSCGVAASERVNDEYAFEERLNDNYNEGDFSESWLYKVGDQNVRVSLDYPFVGWHELTVCYSSNGWGKMKREQHGTKRTDGRIENGYVEATMEKEPHLYGYLIYGVFDPQGNALEPVEEEFWRKLERSLGAFRRVLALVGGESFAADQLPGASYQVQVFVQSSKPLSTDEKANVLKVFEEAKARISQKVAQAQTADEAKAASGEASTTEAAPTQAPGQENS